MKKGFTLAELLGVIVILGALMLIIIPIASSTIKNANEDLYNDQIKNIKLALELWMSDNQRPNDDEYITLSLSQLKEAGLIELDITNPKTKELFPNDMILKIINNNGTIEYEVNENGSNINNYESITSIKVNGNVLEYVELGSTYTDLGATAKDTSNNITSVTTTTIPTLNTNKKGLYLVTYKTTDNVAYRTIVVRDTTGPEITFSSNLEMTYEQSKTYDFKADITVTDNSNEEVTVEVSNNITLIPGDYTIKYIAKDSSGNETIKLRKVTIKE